MEFFNPSSNVNFMGIRRVAVGIALFLIAASIISLATRGLNFALDFTGGTLVEVLYEAPVEQAEVSRSLEAAGVEGAIVQRFSSTNFSIRLSPEAVERLGAAADDLGESSLDGRNAAVIMKSGVYDGKRDSHELMKQEFARENLLHAWYEEGGADVHPFDRTTRPTPKNDIDYGGKYSWSSAVRHQEAGRLEAGPLARQLVAGGSHGESWQHSDPFILDCFRKLGGASVHLRQLARVLNDARIETEGEAIDDGEIPDAQLEEHADRLARAFVRVQWPDRPVHD